MQQTQVLNNTIIADEEVSFFSTIHPSVMESEITASGYQQIEPVSDTSNATSFSLAGNDPSSYYDFSNTYLQLRYQAFQADGTTALSEADRTAILSSPWCLVKDVKLKMNGTVVGMVEHPGLQSHMKNLATKGRHWMETAGKAQHMYQVKQTDNGSQVTAASITPHDSDFVTNSTGWKPSQDPYVKHQIYKAVQTIGATGYYFVQDTRENPYYDEDFKERCVRIDSATDVFLRVADLFPQIDLSRTARGTVLSLEFSKNTSYGEVLYGIVDDATTKISRAVLWLRKVNPSLSGLKIWNDTLAKQPISQANFPDYRLEVIPVEAGFGAGRKHHLISSRVFHPRRVFIAFRRKDRLTDIQRNSLEFGHPYSSTPQIDDLQVLSNGVRTPPTPYKPATEQSRLLNELARISGIDEQESMLVTRSNWEFQGIYAFDLESSDSSSFSSRSNSQLEVSYSITSTVSGAYDVNVLIESEGVLEVDSTSGLASFRNLTY